MIPSGLLSLVILILTQVSTQANQELKSSYTIGAGYGSISIGVYPSLIITSEIVCSEPLPVPVFSGGGGGSLPAKPQEAITENVTKKAKEPSENVIVESLPIQGYAYKEPPEVVKVEVLEPEIVEPKEEKPQVVEPKHEEKTSILDWLVLSGGILLFLGVSVWISVTTRLHAHRKP